MRSVIMRLVRLSVERPKTVLFLIGVFTVICAIQFPKIAIDTDPENMLREDEPIRVFHDRVKEDFGIEELIVLGVVREEGIFNPESLGKIKRITDEVLRIKGVIPDDVMSLTQTNNVVAKDGTLHVRPPVTDVPADASGLERLKREVLDNPLNALGGVLSLEGAYYRSREDEDGDDPFIPNSQSRFLVGYQRQLTADFTVSAQYYLEYMHDFSDYERTLPPDFPRADRLSQLATLRLTELLFHQTLMLSFFSFYSPSDGDYLLIREVKYHFSDHVWAALGANVFGGGGGTGRFGRLDENDNVYVPMRYEFWDTSNGLW